MRCHESLALLTDVVDLLQAHPDIFGVVQLGG